MLLRDVRTWVLAVLVAAAAAGCTSSDDDPAPPVGPAVGGSWVGHYFDRGGSRQDTPITATIRQDGDAIMIRTSLVGVGANLTGTIDAAGDMRLTDAFDGEIWTTHYRPATTNFVQIADFLRQPEPEDQGATPIQIIELTRPS